MFRFIKIEACQFLVALTQAGTLMFYYWASHLAGGCALVCSVTATCVAVALKSQSSLNQTAE